MTGRRRGLGRGRFPQALSGTRAGPGRGHESRRHARRDGRPRHTTYTTNVPRQGRGEAGTTRGPTAWTSVPGGVLCRRATRDVGEFVDRRRLLEGEAVDGTWRDWRDRH